MRRFRRDVAFVHGLVREHRLADDVADREDVRDVRAHLLVDFDEAAVRDGDAGLVGADLLAVRAAADRDQHEVVALRFRRRLLALELHVDAVLLRFGTDRLGLQHHVAEALRVVLLPDLDEVAVRAVHQHVEHFDDVDLGAERRVDRRHFEADDAAADHEHPLRLLAQLERAGRIDDAGSSGRNGSFTDCEPAAMIACLNLTTFLPPSPCTSM